MSETEEIKTQEDTLPIPVHYTPQDFLDEYNALCDRTGYRVTAAPVFVGTNHGTFELSVEYAVSRKTK